MSGYETFFKRFIELQLTPWYLFTVSNKVGENNFSENLQVISINLRTIRLHLKNLYRQHHRFPVILSNHQVSRDLDSSIQ